MPTSIGAQVSQCRGLQSAYINRHIALDLSLPIKAAQLPRGLQSTFKNKRKALDLSLPIITRRHTSLPGLKSWAMIGKKECAPTGARTEKGTEVPIEALPR